MKNNLVKSSIWAIVIAMVLVSTGASSVFADFFRTVGQTFTAPSDISESKYGFGYGDSGWGYGYGYGYGYEEPTTTTSHSSGGGHSSSSHSTGTVGLWSVVLGAAWEGVVQASNRLVWANPKYYKVTLAIEKIYNEVHLLAVATKNGAIDENFKKAYSELVDAVVSGDKARLKAAARKFIAAYTEYKKVLDANVIKEYNVTQVGNNKILFKTPIFKSEKMNKALSSFDKKAARYISEHIKDYGDQENAVEALNNLLLALRAYKEGDRVEAKILLKKYLIEFKSYLK